MEGSICVLKSYSNHLLIRSKSVPIRLLILIVIFNKKKKENVILVSSEWQKLEIRL